MKQMMEMFKTLSRKQPISGGAPTQLAKVLTTLDLTALGIGSTLGVGVYVLAGEVSKITAGPAVILSFLIAVIASIFAGLCYAEFGARVPRAGSAYIYCYVTIGEFVAFLIGWNLILEYSIGSASVVKALSTYVDSLMGNRMQVYLNETMPINVHGLSASPDFFAFGVTILFSLALAFGAKESSILNNVFTLINLMVILYVIITGSFKADSSNWKIPAKDVPEGYGDGGFAPYGITGIVKGAAICFYGFIGFDCIATAGEEAKDPKKSLPFSIIGSLIIVFFAYFGVSTVLTLMLPYFEQNVNAPLPYVFHRIQWPVAEYIVTFGAIFGLCSSLMGSMFPLPRIVYAMASDRLIFEWLGRISIRFHTPIYGTLFAGFLTGLLAALLNLSQLVNMMSIGTLMAYTIVAACVLLLRYEVDDEDEKLRIPVPFMQNIVKYLWNSDKLNIPTKLTSIIVTWEVTLFCIFCLIFGIIVGTLQDNLSGMAWWAMILLSISFLLVIITLVLISRQPVACRPDFFSVPFVPWLPALSILINSYLMVMLDIMTWVRFVVWIAVGLIIYFMYGIRNSLERVRREQKIFVDDRRNVIFTSSRDILVLTGQ